MSNHFKKERLGSVNGAQASGDVWMSNHFKKERRGLVNGARAAEDALYEEFKRPVNSRASSLRGVAGGIVRH